MSWRDGRQAVELGVLTDGLAGCAKCAIPPHLTHAEDILQCGLGAFLSVMCQNTNRQHKNIVPSEKRHGRIWDAYTKLALGNYYIIGTCIYIICKLLSGNSKNVCTYMYMCSCMPSFKPELETVPICDQTLVFFDLETTGLGRFN